MTSIKGTVKHEDISGGVWVLDTGREKFELKGGPQELYQQGKVATVKGKVRKDMVSIGMIGPILEVKEIE